MRPLPLTSDCARCEGVCCVALALDAGPAFAFAKHAGERCRHLTPSARCAIHAELAARGCAGCVAFDCHGAGPRASAAFPGAAQEPTRNRAFLLLLPLHEAIWQIGSARALAIRAGLDASRIARALAELLELSEREIGSLRAEDVDAACARARKRLRELGRALREPRAGQARGLSKPG